MKKLITLTAFMLFTATIVFAAEENKVIPGGGGIAAGTTSLGKLSTNVSLKVSYDNTAFSVATKHLSGNRAFGTAHNDTRIYFIEAGAGVGTAAPPDLSDSDSTAFTTGWTSL